MNRIFISKEFFPVFLFTFCLISIGQAQDEDIQNKSVFYFSPEYFIGIVVPNYTSFPESKSCNAIVLSLGWYQIMPEKKWASFYKFPYTGITIAHSNVGNKEVLGFQYSVFPYIIFNPVNRLNNSLGFKIGLGGSYFTKYYDENENPGNKVIGSQYTWTFQSFLYFSRFISKNTSVNFGAGYLHSSNGHTQLPNFGLNQGAVSVSLNIFPKSIDLAFKPKESRIPVNYDKYFLFMIRNGLGIHEYGNAGGPVGGPKRLVNSLSLSGGILFREHIKFNFGFSGRYYHHYYHQITESQNEKYINHPKRNSSNVYFFTGAEFLAGHIGIVAEGGLNLYKPFFRQQYLDVEGPIDTDYWLKQLFNARLGLNCYLLNTTKNPSSNIFIAAYINANFGQADFSEVSFGVVRNLKKSF
jgi:hypothetical protein